MNKPLMWAASAGAALMLAGCASEPPEPAVNAQNAPAEAPAAISPTTEPAQPAEPTTQAQTQPPEPVQAQPQSAPTFAAADAQPPAVSLTLAAEGFTSPVALTSAPGTDYIYVADQTGYITVHQADGSLIGTFLDMRDRLVRISPAYDERGLLGLAFHPDFAANGRFFVYYSAPGRPDLPDRWDHTGTVAEYNLVEGNPLAADPASHRVILEVDQPYSNHNGGQLAFGPDGFLYLGLGDGGSAGDPLGSGQDLDRLLGKILRIDINATEGDDGYISPPDNPFIGQDGQDEVYAYGLRNPYRFSFDSVSGMLFAGDVGQNLFEEVNIIERGGNYGWDIREAASCFNEGSATSPRPECPNENNGDPLMAPILDYGHDWGISVIGGYVYRGSDVPGLQGYYVFGDWNGTLMAAAPRDEAYTDWTFWPLMVNGNQAGQVGESILAFGTGPDQALYMLTKAGPSPTGSSGKVWRITAAQ